MTDETQDARVLYETDYFEWGKHNMRGPFRYGNWVRQHDYSAALDRAEKAEAERDRKLDAHYDVGYAQGVRDAAGWCSDEADRCDDAAKWGGSRRYTADCKAASYALRNASAKILALLPAAPALGIGGDA